MMTFHSVHTVSVSEERSSYSIAKIHDVKTAKVLEIFSEYKIYLSDTYIFWAFKDFRVLSKLCVCPSRWIISTIFVKFWFKMHSNGLNKNLRWHFFHFLKFCFDDVITVILYVFQWGTLMVVIFKQFSSNWQHVFFYGWLCMGLQTSVLRHHL